MSGRTDLAASTGSAFGRLFRLAPAIDGSSRSPRTPTADMVLAFLLDILELVGFHVRVIVPRRGSRDQEHGTDEEQDQSVGEDPAGARTGAGPPRRPNPGTPDRPRQDTPAPPKDS